MVLSKTFTNVCREKRQTEQPNSMWSHQKFPEHLNRFIDERLKRPMPAGESETDARSIMRNVRNKSSGRVRHFAPTNHEQLISRDMSLIIRWSEGFAYCVRLMPIWLYNGCTVHICYIRVYADAGLYWVLLPTNCWL